MLLITKANSANFCCLENFKIEIIIRVNFANKRENFCEYADDSRKNVGIAAL